MSHPLPPAVVGPPDRGMVERIEWPNRWMSADGRVWLIPTMSTAHLWAVLGYLRWFAPELALRSGTSGMTRAALRQWLTDRPVWIAIATELARRQEIAGDVASGLVFAHLEDAGSVPWERVD